MGARDARSAGGAAPPEAIFDHVADDEGVDCLDFLLEYARLLRGRERRIVHTMAAPYQPLLLPRLKADTAEARANAVLMLARMGMPTYAGVVAETLEDDSALVAMIAARSLFRPEHEAHFPAVLDHLPRFTG